MSDTTKKSLKIMLVLEIIVLAIGMVFTKNPLYYAIGVVLGAVVSSIQLILIEKAIIRSVDMTPVNAQNYVRLHYMLRMAAFAVVAFIAIKVRFIDILGFLMGIFPMMPALFINGLFLGEKDDNGEQTKQSRKEE